MIEVCDVAVSERTIQGGLKEHDIISFIPTNDTNCLQIRRQVHLRFARGHINLSEHHWASSFYVRYIRMVQTAAKDRGALCLYLH